MKVSTPSPHLAEVRCAQDMRQDSPLCAGEVGEQSAAPALPLDFTAVYDRHFHDVLRWIRALGGPDAELEDLAQEVFVVVRRKLAAFDGGNLPGWLYTIAKLTVRDHARRAWVRRIFRGRRAIELDELASVSGDPEALLASRENQRLFYRLVGQMSERRRATFVLFEVEGYSCEEIARLQDVPVGTVWTRLHHARKEFIAKVKGLPPGKAGGP
jgi:RNA polymerase sigma-70 factor (ECF subfamily)